MNSDFGNLICESIDDINSLKEKLLSGEYSSIAAQGLFCESKKRIVESYLTVLGNTAVIISAITQLLIIMKTTDDISNRIFNAKKLLRDSFTKGIIDQIQNSEHCSGCPKSAILFSIMQNQLEDVFFSEVSSKLIPFIGSVNGEKFEICQEILDDLYEFAEAALLHLSGLRFNCTNIKDSLYDDERYPINKSNIRRLDPEYSSLQDMPPGDCLFKSADRAECLHIFIYDGMLKIKKWLDVYTNLYAQYHKYPKRLNLILDYKLVTEYSWDEKDLAFYIKCKDLFGEVFIINYDNVDFKNHKDKLNITTFDKIGECMIS